MDLRVGDVIYGESTDQVYEIVKPCGSGQFGMVYEIKDRTGARFALKTLVTAWLEPAALKALQNEGRLATRVRHMNALTLHYFHDGDVYPNLPPYLIMDFADGGTLQNVLEARAHDGQMFSNAELRSMFAALCSGMKAVNEHLVHRDIKPDNILVGRQNYWTLLKKPELAGEDSCFAKSLSW